MHNSRGWLVRLDRSATEVVVEAFSLPVAYVIMT